MKRQKKAEDLPRVYVPTSTNVVRRDSWALTLATVLHFCSRNTNCFCFVFVWIYLRNKHNPGVRSPHRTLRLAPLRTALARNIVYTLSYFPPSRADPNSFKAIKNTRKKNLLYSHHGTDKNSHNYLKTVRRSHDINYKSFISLQKLHTLFVINK